MPTGKRDLEAALQNALQREKLLEGKLQNRKHVLNLVVNGWFNKFYIAHTENGAVHDFSIGVLLHNVETDGPFDRLIHLSPPTENYRFILWRSEHAPGHIFASGFSEKEFLELPTQLDDFGAEIKNLIQDAIKKIPPRNVLPYY